jgi:BASS family bile acid:Na+ symporter
MLEFLSIAIKLVVFLLMLVVGLDCELSGFRKSFRGVGLITVVTLAQFICIPAIAVAVICLLQVPFPLAGGILLIASCPSGSISNVYTFLAKGDTTLSVTLTTVSCIISLFATPLALSLSFSYLGTSGATSLSIPWAPLTQQILLLMALPITLGLLIRRRMGAGILGALKMARVLSTVLVTFLVVIIICSNPAEMAKQLSLVWAPALALTSFLFLLAWQIGRAFRLSRSARITVFFELPCRNLAIAALIGISVLNRPEFVYVATAFFVVEALLLASVLGIALLVNGT